MLPFFLLLSLSYVGDLFSVTIRGLLIYYYFGVSFGDLRLYAGKGDLISFRISIHFQSAQLGGRGQRYGFKISARFCGWGRLIACRKTCPVVGLYMHHILWGLFLWMHAENWHGFNRSQVPGWLVKMLNILWGGERGRKKKVKLRWSLSHAAGRALICKMLEVAYLLLRGILCSVPEDQLV